MKLSSQVLSRLLKAKKGHWKINIFRGLPLHFAVISLQRSHGKKKAGDTYKIRIEKTLRLESRTWPVGLGLCIFQGKDELIIQFEVFGRGQVRPLRSARQYWPANPHLDVLSECRDMGCVHSSGSPPPLECDKQWTQSWVSVSSQNGQPGCCGEARGDPVTSLHCQQVPASSATALTRSDRPLLMQSLHCPKLLDAD